MRVALDTNVLAYVEGVNGAVRRQSAIALVQSLAKGGTVVPVQALGQLYNVLGRKSGWPGDQARADIHMRDAFPLAPTTEAAMIAAADLAADRRLDIWDSLMVAVAAEGGCRLLLSEDMQDGFSQRGVTVVNPFAANPSSAAWCSVGRDWAERTMNSAEIRERLATELRFDLIGPSHRDTTLVNEGA